jgi:hypothetical protein
MEEKNFAALQKNARAGVVTTCHGGWADGAQVNVQG